VLGVERDNLGNRFSVGVCSNEMADISVHMTVDSGLFPMWIMRGAFARFRHAFGARHKVPKPHGQSLLDGKRREITAAAGIIANASKFSW